MSRPDLIGNEVRKARRERRLGPNAVCFLCGFADPAALLLVQRTSLERHHVFGVGHIPRATVPLCRNCHALLTEQMLDAAVPLAGQHLSKLEVIEAVIRARVVFLRADADASQAFADDLQLLINDLDEHLPGWRELERGKPE